MKSYSFLLFVTTAIACTPSKSNDLPADSAAVSPNPALIDSVIIPKKIEVEPPIAASQLKAPAFDMFSDKLYTEDEREITMTKNLSELIEQFKEQKFASIKRAYTVNYKTGNDYDDVLEDQYQTETQIWYYNANRELCAYTHEMEAGAPGEDPDRQTSAIYLFASDTVQAIFSDKFSGGQSFLSTHDRIVTSACPLCGVRLIEDGSVSSGIQVTETSPGEVAGRYELFEGEYQEVLNELSERSLPESTTGDYALTLVKPWNENTYVVNFTIARPLYSKFLKGK